MFRVGVVPGFRSDATDDAWDPVYEGLINKGLDPYPIRVQWAYTTMADNVAAVREGCEEGGLCGHSFGVLACLYASLRVKPSFVVASSPSPYLAEYIDELDPKHRQDIGKR